MDKLWNKRGFTLLEIIVILGILSVIVAISIPALSGFSDSADVKAKARDMVAAFKKARFEAINRNTACSIVFGQTVDGVEYDYIVFVDDDTNIVGGDIPDGIFDSSEESLVMEVLERSTLDSSKGGGDGTTFVNNVAGEPYVVWDPRGLPMNTSGGFSSGTVYFVSPGGVEKSVVLSSAGRIRIQ